MLYNYCQCKNILFTFFVILQKNILKYLILTIYQNYLKIILTKD